MPAIDRATSYVNKIGTDKQLEGITTVLFLIEKNDAIDEDKLVESFKNWSEDKAKRFSRQDIIDCVNYLEDTGIVIKNLCGIFELSDYML